MVTYIDRVNISVTARHMMPAYGLTEQDMGWVFSAFVLGYAFFQIPGGWLADRWGARTVLFIALLWWSACTWFTAVAAASPLAGPFGIIGALMLIRGILGAGEAVALPAFNRAVTNWLPEHQRGLGIGIAIGGIGLGSALTPPIAAWVMVNWGWQTVFLTTAMLGLAMGLLWWSLAHDSPHNHPWVNEGERGLIGFSPQPSYSVVPWQAFWRTSTVRWLVVSYTCLGYVAYVYMSWLYLYLVNVRGFDVLRGGFYAATPFVAMLIGCPLGGWVSDRMVRRYGITTGRAVAGFGGMFSAGLAVIAGGFVESPLLAIASLSLGAGCLYFTVGAYWASTTDLSPEHAGTLSGMMNMGANIGGALSPSLTPWLAGRWGWPAALGFAGCIALLGAGMWFRIKPGDGLTKTNAAT